MPQLILGLLIFAAIVWFVVYVVLPGVAIAAGIGVCIGLILAIYNYGVAFFHNVVKQPANP